MQVINEFVPYSKDIIGQSRLKEKSSIKTIVSNQEDIIDDVSKVAIMAITSMTGMVKMVSEAIIKRINE